MEPKDNGEYKVTKPSLQHRRTVRSADKVRKRKQKKYLKSTYYLTIEQFAAVMKIVIADADSARAKTKHLDRAVINEMQVISMAETGLRAAEICNLKLKDLSYFHGKPEINVRRGKGNKDRINSSILTLHYYSILLMMSLLSRAN